MANEVSAASLDLDAAQDLRIHISGCPNGCGRHSVADVGLYGVARRVNGRLVPHYVLQVGGHVAEGATRFAQGDQAVPAKSLPQLVRELIAEFRASSQYPRFDDFLNSAGRRLVDALVEQYQSVPESESGEDYYFDWGADELFSLAGAGRESAARESLI